MASSPGRTSATVVTLASFYLVAIGLSLLPVPSWLKPTDLLSGEDPLAALTDALFTKPESIPLPDQMDDQIQATGDPLLLDGDLNEDETPVAEVTPVLTPKPTQMAWTMPDRPHFDRYAERLGLRAADVEYACAEPPGIAADQGACKRRSLARFFRSLRAVETGAESAETVRVVHFGDSLIASDKISDMVRRRLQERFGSSGRGFLMAKRFNQFQRGNRSGRGSEGWGLDVMTTSIHRLKDRHFGFSGASFTSARAGETLVFEPVGASRYLDLFYLSYPRGGGLELLANGEPVGRVQTRSEVPVARVSRHELPTGTETLVVKSTGKGARVYGVSLEAQVPGVIWTTLGLPGATSEVWLRPQADEFVRLLKQHQPHLAVFMVGGNDGLMLSKKRTTLDDIERATRALVGRVRGANPDMDCLLVSPLEAVRAKGGGRMIPKPEVPQVIKILRRVARQQGCGFWDMYTSMGGNGSLRRWVNARLMLGDLIHPRSRGSDLLGEMMAEALMEAYDRSLPQALPSQGVQPSNEALPSSLGTVQGTR